MSDALKLLEQPSFLDKSCRSCLLGFTPKTDSFSEVLRILNWHLLRLSFKQRLLEVGMLNQYPILVGSFLMGVGRIQI